MFIYRSGYRHRTTQTRPVFISINKCCFQTKTQKMALRIPGFLSSSLPFSSHPLPTKSSIFKTLTLTSSNRILRSKSSKTSRKSPLPLISAALPPLDLNEENVRQVLLDARSEVSTGNPKYYFFVFDFCGFFSYIIKRKL